MGAVHGNDCHGDLNGDDRHVRNTHGKGLVPRHPFSFLTFFDVLRFIPKL